MKRRRKSVSYQTYHNKNTGYSSHTKVTRVTTPRLFGGSNTTITREKVEPRESSGMSTKDIQGIIMTVFVFGVPLALIKMIWDDITTTHYTIWLALWQIFCFSVLVGAVWGIRKLIKMVKGEKPQPKKTLKVHVISTLKKYYKKLPYRLTKK